MSRFEHDLFISYAHIDNEPTPPMEEGWISRLHDTLEPILKRRLGRKISIWRDDELQSNDVFPLEIVQQFNRTAALLSIISPRYLESDWCKREIVEFCKTAEENGGVTVGNKARVFKAVTSPVEPSADLPKVVNDTIGREFYTYDGETPLELDAVYGSEFEQRFVQQVAGLAWELCQLIQSLEKQKTAETKPFDGSTVYLAETSFEMRPMREKLATELKQHGYRVLPEQSLPRDESAYVSEVKHLLNSCDLSVHMIGEKYGAVPDGPSQKSVVELQNALTVEYSKSNKMPRIIWLDESIERNGPQQTIFVEALHTKAEVQLNADLLTGNFENLKTTVYSTLKRIAAHASGTSTKDEDENEARDDDAVSLVYLMMTEGDRKAAIPLRKHLRQMGCKVALPAFSGEAGQVRQAQRDALATCDAVIIFYGEGDEAWKRTIDTELIKMAGYRCGPDPKGIFTYLAGPDTVDKSELVELEEPDLIDCRDQFPAIAMREFDNRLEE